MSDLPPNDPVPPTPEPTPGGATPVTPVGAATPEAADIEKNKIMAILAYIGILVLVPIFAAKESPFARYHANQGLVLMIAGFVGIIVLSVLTVFVGLMPLIHFCACAMFPLIWLYGLAWMAMSILGIINAANGKMKPLPVIGGFTILK